MNRTYSEIELIAKIESLSDDLKKIDKRHGQYLLSAVQEVKDRINGKDF